MPSNTPRHPDLSAIPGDTGLPLIGYSLRYLRNPLAFAQQRADQHGEIVWQNMFGQRVLSLLGPDGNELVLRNRDNAFASSAWEYFLAKFFHRGLMLLDFDEHRFHRRIMQSAFRHAALEQYLGLMTPEIDHIVDSWPTDQPMRVFDALKTLTLDLASIAFIGERPGSEADAVNKAFLDTVQAATGIIRQDWPGTRWRRGLRGRALLERFFAARVAPARATERADLFSQLCHAEDESGQQFSDDDVINHMIFLMMAAHDTSTITLTTMLYQLALHPQWQERLRAQSQALGQAQLRHEDLATLEDMDLVMKEALRLCPPVPQFPRKTVKEVSFKGYRIPAGTMVNISPIYTHHLPEYWPDPTRFDPERFSAARREDRQHAYQWLPFGGGAHKCIGLFFGDMEVKAILHALLLRYRWTVPQGYTMPINWLSLPIPKDGLPITLTRLTRSK